MKLPLRRAEQPTIEAWGRLPTLNSMTPEAVNAHGFAFVDLLGEQIQSRDLFSPGPAATQRLQRDCVGGAIISEQQSAPLNERGVIALGPIQSLFLRDRDQIRV